MSTNPVIVCSLVIAALGAAMFASRIATGTRAAEPVNSFSPMPPKC